MIHTSLLILTASIVGFSQESDCSRITSFGDVEICLPFINGYVECYTDPLVKEMADKTEIAINSVLGYYLNDDTYEQRSMLGIISFDDYFKIYATNQLAELDADVNMLNEVKSALSGNFFEKSWDSLVDEFIDDELQVEIGVPTMIKDYQINDNSFTFLMITKYEVENQEPTIIAMSMSGMLVNKRLVWMAYYLNYDGEESIDKLQGKTDQIVTAFMDAQRS